MERSGDTRKLLYKHLGHILSNDLSDNPDIIAVKQSMCCKASHLMLIVFRVCDPHIQKKQNKTNSCQVSVSLCMVQHVGGFIRTTLFGSFLKIWSLPRHCHTTIYNEAVVIISSLVAIYFSETSNTRIYPVRVLNHEIWHTDIGEYGKWFFIRIRFQVMPLIYKALILMIAHTYCIT